ncbi:C-type lectin domain family 10 member A-like isoform X4 [Carassius gibelio]|uniref:C-type lectin domain family 10 member A-like isoform X4 n=1 Tax=Carassius gibelio TaxID=101364 RepID=UPI0022777B22|nr:C-type lectin domain family 10 member A-like isoform X4 [Carassius gibelio]
MAQKIDTREGQRKTDDIYENADVMKGEITVEMEDLNITRIHPSEHTGSDSVKIRSSRAAVVCLVLLSVLLLTAVIVLCVQVFTNIDLFQTKGKNILEERDQLLTRNRKLTEERDLLLITITSFSEDRDWLLHKNINLTNERDDIVVKNDNLIKQRDQLSWKIKEMMKNIHEMDGWIYHEFSFYYISSEMKSWTESRRYCTERGADLIIINNTEEQEFVNTISGGAEVWIGLTDIEVEGSWKWVDGSTVTSEFWWSTEPNGQRGENCALNNKRWADYPCNSVFKWVCEKSVLHYYI